MSSPTDPLEALEPPLNDDSVHAARRIPYGWLAGSASLYVLWTLATFLLEGSRRVALRPYAVAEAATYIGLVHIALGTVAASAFLWALIESGFCTPEQMGLHPFRRSALRIGVALVIGAGVFVAQSPASLAPWVVLNTFSHAVGPAVAEVLICWSLLGAATEALLKRRGPFAGLMAHLLVSSLLFAAYNLAHSPPFNKPQTLIFLAIVALGTGLFFLLSRDLLATVIFHAFVGMSGLMEALTDRGQLEAYAEPIPALHLMALVSLTILVGSILVLRHREVGRAAEEVGSFQRE